MKTAKAMHTARTSTDNPFSSNAWQPLRILTFYRVILAGLLTVLYFSLQDSNPFNVQIQQLFKSTLLTYLVFSVAAGFATRLHWPGYDFQGLLQVLADIGAIALLMHATGGVTSALAVLLVIAVAAGALILPGRMAYLFASVATLAVLFETGLASLSLDKAGAGDITRAGLMGAVFFIAAGLAHVLVIRARTSEALAEQRGIDLANLEQLNRYIISQLQAGVMVIDPDSKIRLVNETARTLLNLTAEGKHPLQAEAPELAAQLKHWKADRQWQPEAFQAHQSNTTLVPRFSALETAQGEGALILLDDSTQLAQQTQQLKLASLGRLTASIAHEIRNPLGAISHAAQLLGESEHLDHDDRRLSEIIGNHTRRVNTIIENVLQLSRRSASQPQTLKLDQWLRQFHEEFTQSEGIQADQLALDSGSETILIRVDPGHLHQVLTNLCENGLRHSRNDEARVRLTVSKETSGVVHLDVIDNGPGIDAETAEQMFEPFYTTATTGTGLGLYIARELCEINQARLSYHPITEGGTCFRIYFAAQPDQVSAHNTQNA